MLDNGVVSSTYPWHRNKHEVSRDGVTDKTNFVQEKIFQLIPYLVNLIYLLLASIVTYF